MKEIKCYQCNDGKVLPTEQILCNGSFPLGVPLINGTIQPMPNTGSKQKAELNALFESSLSTEQEDYSQDFSFVCFKMVFNDTRTNQEVVSKGCIPKDSTDLACDQVKAKECITCDTNLCNATSSITFSLAMILLPILAFIFIRS
ncbi:uncharacterized protein [Prorops nasuta]